MYLLALKMLMGDRLKYLSLLAGLTFAAMLITQQTSIYNGFASRIGAWIRDTSVADLWVMDEQVDFSDDIKPVFDTALLRVRGVEGVGWAVPLYKNYLNAIFPDGTRTNVRLVGLDDATLTGGPPLIVSGHIEDLRQDRAILINADLPVMLHRFDPPRALRLGDRVSLNDNEMIVVGSYRSSPEFFWEPVFYTTFSQAKFLRRDLRRQVQFIMVKVREGSDPTVVAGRIRGQLGYQALTTAQFEKRSTDWMLDKTGIRVNFGLTIALGFVIGVLAAGQTLFSFILDNLRYFAAMKAMGATNGLIIRMVMMQVMVAGLISYGVGIGIASLTGLIFHAGGLAFQMSWPIVLIGFLSLLFCCLVAAIFSLRQVIRMEPGIVFK